MGSSLESQPFIDFSECLESDIQYAGSELKKGIIYNDEYFMLKFRKEIEGRKCYNHISEYVSSHIMELAGLDVHRTLLGTYKGEDVVAVHDFVAGTKQFLVEFNSAGESSFDTEKSGHTLYTYDEILYLIRRHTKVENTQEVVERFWDMFVMDALTANFDRHGYNWGVIKGVNVYRLAPIYDNGSSLFPRLRDEELNGIMENRDEMNKRTYLFPTSQIKLRNKKSSYYDVIHSHMFEECDRAIDRMFKVLDFHKVDLFLEHVPEISEIRKKFYKCILMYRYEKLFQRKQGVKI